MIVLFGKDMLYKESDFEAIKVLKDFSPSEAKQGNRVRSVAEP